MDRKRLILFTTSFPYGVEEAFLENEVPILAEKYDITIIPAKIKKGIRKTKENVYIDNSLAKKLSYKNDLAKLECIIKSFKKYRNEFKIVPKKLKTIKKMLAYIFLSEQLNEWFKENNKHKVLNNRTIFYSYWLNSICFAMLSIKKILPDSKYIARVHRFDLYEESPDNKYNYIPFRKYILEKITKVFCISKDGADYLKKKYPMYKDKVELSYLGVKKQKYISKDKNKKIFDILSCSSITTVKRVGLILETIKILKEKNKDMKIIWTHIGDGRLKKEIEKQINEIKDKTKLKCFLKGSLINEEVLNYYKKNKIDLFINLSSSEGLPVSIMEALSFGIPVIATDVGGTKELIDEDVGYIIEKDEGAEKIAEKIEMFIKKAEKEKKKMMRNAYRRWNEKVNAEKTYKEFCEKIMKI